MKIYFLSVCKQRPIARQCRKGCAVLCLPALRCDGLRRFGIMTHHSIVAALLPSCHDTTTWLRQVCYFALCCTVYRLVLVVCHLRHVALAHIHSDTEFKCHCPFSLVRIFVQAKLWFNQYEDFVSLDPVLWLHHENYGGGGGGNWTTYQKFLFQAWYKLFSLLLDQKRHWLLVYCVQIRRTKWHSYIKYVVIYWGFLVYK